VTAWETTTTQTAWSSAAEPAGPATREAGQPAVVAGPTTPAGAGTAAAEGVRSVAAHAGSAGYPAAASAKTELGGAAGSTAVTPAAAAVTSTTAASVGAATPIGRSSRRSRALSRTTMVALIAVAICVLVAALAIFG
jgi:hypothetical protein